MASRLRWPVLMICAGMSAIFPIGAGAKGAECDRTCLGALLDTYFSSIRDHNAGALKVVTDVKVTENSARISLGQGIWLHGGPAVYRLDAIDSVSGEAASNAVITEDGKKVIFFARIKQRRRRIAEIETIIVRKGTGQISDPDSFTERPTLYDQDIALSDRNSRQELKSAAQAYFDALATAGTDHYNSPPVTVNTIRIENGMHFGPPPGGAMPRKSMDEQLRKGFGNDKLHVADIRYPVIDEQHGVVLAIGMMHVDRGPDPEGKDPSPPKGLHSVDSPKLRQTLVEFFKVSRGQILEIQATMFDLNDPNLITTGWPP